MNLLSCLHHLPWHFAVGSAQAVPHHAAAGACDAAPGQDGAPQGCGWFDSSHELQQGLLVREHIDPAALATEMPLGLWLELQLSAWRPGLAS